MPKCPKCGHKFTEKCRVKGGEKSRRKITPEQQEKMQEARAKKKVDEGEG